MALDSITIAAIGQGAMGIGQGIAGGIQASKAREVIRELQKNSPTIEVPSALRQLAGEPIAEDYIEAQEMGGQRRTAQSIDALGKGGSRTLAGALPQVMESERIGEQQRAGQYEQARKGVMGQLANAEERNQQLRLSQYFADLNAARSSLDAGQQNIMGGIGGVASGASMGLGQQYGQGGDEQMKTIIELLKNQNNTPNQYTQEQLQGANLASNALGASNTLSFFEKGGILKTKGVFSHRKNPKYLVDGESGEVEAELTGSETVFNEADSDKIEEMANKGEGKKLSKFVKGRYKSFNSKRNR